MQSYDHLFRIVVIGNSGVGKSTILSSYVDKAFDETYMSTIGVDLFIKTVDIQDKTIKLQIWDTAGQCKYRAITNSYYRGCNGILIIFDVTNKDSFESIQYWMEEINRYVSEDVVKYIIGNKSDLSNKREVSYEEAKSFADFVKLPYIETSAKNFINLNLLFESLVTDLVKIRKNKEYDEKYELDKLSKETVVNLLKKDNVKKCC